MLPSFSKLRIGGAKKAARTPARVGVAIPCDELKAQTGEDEKEVDERAWDYIVAHPELEDMVTLRSLAEGYRVENHWANHLWYLGTDGDKRVVKLPDGWDKGPTAIIRVSPFCTDENGRKLAEYVLKGTLLAYFAHQRYAPIHQHSRNLLFPKDYLVPGGTGRDTFVPAEKSDPDYEKMRVILERFLDECEAIVVNPEMPDEAQRRLYDRGQDRLVAPVWNRIAEEWQPGNPHNPFPSWDPLGRVEDVAEEEEEEDHLELFAPGGVGRYMERSEMIEKFLRAMERLEIADSPTHLMKANAIEKANDLARAWNRSDHARDYLLRERFFRAIGQTGLYALFVELDTGFQGEIVSFWYTITEDSTDILQHLRGEFEVGVDSPIERWFRFVPDGSLDQEFDDGTTLRTRALTFVSDMLLKHIRHRSVSGFLQNAHELTRAEVRNVEAMDTTIGKIEAMVRSIESAANFTQGALEQTKLEPVRSSEFVERLVIKLNGVAERFGQLRFASIVEKQRHATRVFEAGLEAHWAIHFAYPYDQSVIPDSEPVLQAFDLAMRAVVEAVDSDRDGGLFERANQFTLERFFWQFVVPLERVWVRMPELERRRRLEFAVWGLLFKQWPERPGVLSLPPSTDAPPSQTHAEIMDGIIRGGKFTNFTNIQNASSQRSYDVYKARTATVNQTLLTLKVMAGVQARYDRDVRSLGDDVQTLANEIGEVTFPSLDQFLETAISLAKAAHAYALLCQAHLETHTDTRSPDFLAATKPAFTSLLKGIVRRTIRYARFLDDRALVNQISFGWFLEVVVRPFSGSEDVIDEMEAMYMPYFALPGEGDDWDDDALTESDSETEPPTPQALTRARSSGEATPGRRRQRTGAAI
tara:strand:- start:5278 stop:7884 length:2607 start_codon:yes stop_codon:yes gene_type:complete